MNTIDSTKPKATIKAGSGYWDVTIYPYGGCFKRVKVNTPCEIVAYHSFYNDGSVKEYHVLIGESKAIVGDSQIILEGELK